MPIYAYRCEACGHTKDVLQKVSDPVLTDCPACGAPAFKKQLTAAGFQLKGSGWYVTDFRGGAQTSSKTDSTTEGAATSEPAETESTNKAEAAAPAPAASTAAPPPSGSPPSSTK